MVTVAGVDVDKAHLDVSVSEGPVIRFDNTAQGIAKLLKYLKSQDATMAVCESTGGYERLLVSRLRKTEIRHTWPTRLRCAPSRGPAATKPKPTPRTPRCCPTTAAVYNPEHRGKNLPILEPSYALMSNTVSQAHLRGE